MIVRRQGDLGVHRFFAKLSVLRPCSGILALAACSQLPAAGPSTQTVIDQATNKGVAQFQLVDVTDNVVDTLQSRPTPTFSSQFGQDGMPPEPTLNVGDSVAISIWEAGGNGLFQQEQTINGIPSGSRPASIPAQIVSRDGKISVPFDGRVQVAGRTVIEVQDEIRRSLQGKAVDPQVIVTVSASVANAVTVSGEVVNGSRIPISPYGMRLLDVIAAAGGAKAPIYETFIKLSRHQVTVTLPLETLVDDPQENIFAWPGDDLTLVHVPEFFEAFGATGKNAEIPIGEQRVSVAQALGKASGLLDERADPAGVFLFRFEPAKLVSKMTRAPVPKDGNSVPVVYHFDMSNANSYFLAQRFKIENKDIIYVATANANQLEKFLGLVNAITGSILNPIVNGIVITNTAP